MAVTIVKSGVADTKRVAYVPPTNSKRAKIEEPTSFEKDLSQFSQDTINRSKYIYIANILVNTG